MKHFEKFDKHNKKGEEVYRYDDEESCCEICYGSMKRFELWKKKTNI